MPGKNWYFEDGRAGSGQWKQYSPGDSAVLRAGSNAAGAGGPNTITLSNRWGTYTVTLNATQTGGKQVNSMTGGTRRVICGTPPALRPAITVGSLSPAAFGEVTQDYAAAMALAKAKGGHILLIFSGSDWCGWCKIMDKNVFSHPAWKTLAGLGGALPIVGALCDFPQNKRLVPASLVGRNQILKQQYAVSGYPTYFILDAQGKVLGRLGAGRNKTPASFFKEVQGMVGASSAAAPVAARVVYPAVAGGSGGGRWMFEDGRPHSGNWKPYRKQDSDTIEAAYTTQDSKAQGVPFQINNSFGMYTIRFKVVSPVGQPDLTTHGMQTNMRTGANRRIKRL